MVTFFGCKPLAPEPDYHSEDAEAGDDQAGAEEIEMAAANDNKEEYKERPADAAQPAKKSSINDGKRRVANGKAQQDNSQVSQPGAAQSQHDSIHSSAYEMVDVPMEEPPSPVPGAQPHHAQPQPHEAVECRIEIKEPAPATVNPTNALPLALPLALPPNPGPESSDSKVVFHDDAGQPGPSV